MLDPLTPLPLVKRLVESFMHGCAVHEEVLTTSRKKSLRILMAATGVLLLLPLGTLAYAAPTSATGNVESVGGTLRPAEAADQAWMLEDTGVQTANYQTEWALLTTRIGELLPDDYAGSMIQDGKYVVGFKGAVPPAVSKLLSQFSADYVAMTNLGFSRQDIEALSESIVEAAIQNAPDISMEILPGALSSQITVSVDAASLPDITPGGVATSGGATVNQRVTKTSVDLSSVTLTAQEKQRLQALASVLAVPSDSALQVVVVPNTGDAPLPTTVI